MSSRVHVDQYFDVISIMLVVFDVFRSFISEKHYLIPETLASNFLTGVLGLEDKEKVAATVIKNRNVVLAMEHKKGMNDRCLLTIEKHICWSSSQFL